MSTMIPLNRLRWRTIAAVAVIAAVTVAAVAAIDAYAAPPITRGEVEQQAKDKVIDICLASEKEQIDLVTFHMYHCFSPEPLNPPYFCDVGPPLRNDVAVCRGRFTLLPTDEGIRHGRHRHVCSTMLRYQKHSDGSVDLTDQHTNCVLDEG